MISSKMTNCAILMSLFLVATKTFLTARRISKHACGSSGKMYLIAENHILDEEPISKHTVVSVSDCLDLCIEATKCVAMNTHEREASRIDCHLLKDDHLSKPKKTVRKKGWKLYDTGSKDISRTIGSRCSSMANNPCASHCTCVDTCDSYRCDCYGPEIFKSCHDALLEYPDSERYHWIQRENQTTAVYAQCIKHLELSMHKTIGTIITKIEHDVESRVTVRGHEAPLFYKRSINYNVNNFKDIIAYVNSSSNCRQHTKFECTSSAIHRQNMTRLIGRDGWALKYFGGGPSNGEGCSCGITNSCKNKQYKCNCDSNDGSYKDEGYVVDKSVLPLTGIWIGDTGDTREEAHFTIGKLECWEPFTSCHDALKYYSAGASFHWIKHKGMKKAVMIKCSRDNDGKIWAEFDHDSEGRTYVSGYEKAHSYQRPLKYNAANKMENIIKFIQTSQSCRQFTKVECKGMVFLHYNDGYIEGRGGKKLSYFGGGPASGRGCACGKTGTCKNPDRKCNCDSNDQLTSDEGYVTKKMDLPLTKIALGDTGSSSEYAYHTIGKLQCTE